MRVLLTGSLNRLFLAALQNNNNFFITTNIFPQNIDYYLGFNSQLTMYPKSYVP